jgi:hypothetical protein
MRCPNPKLIAGSPYSTVPLGIERCPSWARSTLGGWWNDSHHHRLHELQQKEDPHGHGSNRNRFPYRQ